MQSFWFFVPYLKVLHLVAKELGALRSTQSGGAKPPQIINLKNLKLINIINNHNGTNK